jgi:ribosomal protein S17E
VKLGEIIENYKTILFSKFQKKKIVDNLSQIAIKKLDKNNFQV